MPYRIINSGTGYKVSDGKGNTFSKKPLSFQNANKQRIAIALSESRKKNIPVNYFF